MKLKLTSLRPGLTTSLFGLWLAGIAAAQTTSFGTSCPGGSGQDAAIELSGFPYVGLPISAIIRGPALAPGLLIGGTSTLLPLDLTSLGLTSCYQVVPLEFILGNFTTDASGNAQLAFTAPANGAGLTVNLQALVIDPGSGPFGSTLGGVTGGLGITFQPLPAGNTPIISNFGPLSAEPGGMITLQGANLGTDLGALSVFIDSPVPTYFQPVSLSGNSLTVRLNPYTADGVAAGPLTIARGIGGQIQLGQTGGVAYTTPSVGHCFNPADPTSSSQTLADFTPKQDPQPLTTACAGVVADTNGASWKQVASWSLSNGDLVLQVPQNLCGMDEPVGVKIVAA